MYLLAIETTGAFASVALMQTEGEQILGVIHGNDRFSHLQNLTPQIEEVLKQSALQIGDIDAIAVSHGPGSFTGIRIGVSTARALAQILKIPCIAVSSLEALALRATEEISADSAGEIADNSASEIADNNAGKITGNILICPVLDARRKQVYGAAYELTESGLICRIEPASILMKDFLQKVDEYTCGREMKLCFLGDGIDTCDDILQEWMGAPDEAGNCPADEAGAPDEAEAGPATEAGAAPSRVHFAPKQLRYQDAGAVARRGAQLLLEGRTCDYMDLQPEYLRMAEAEKKLRDKLAAEKRAKDESAQKEEQGRS